MSLGGVDAGEFFVCEEFAGGEPACLFDEGIAVVRVVVLVDAGVTVART